MKGEETMQEKSGEKGHFNGTSPITDQADEEGKERAYTENLMLYSIYLPLNYNDGSPIPADKLMWAHTEIVHYAGGSTVFPVTDGWWISADNQQFHDLITVIQVVAATDWGTKGFFCHLAGVLAKLLEQQEIFIHGMPVVIMKPSPEKSVALQLA